MDAFLLKDKGRQRTLADLIVEKIKENDAAVVSEVRPVPKLDKSILDNTRVTYMHSRRSSHYWKHSTKGFHSSTSFKCGVVEACRDEILWNNKVKQTSWKRFFEIYLDKIFGTEAAYSKEDIDLGRDALAGYLLSHVDV
ncbi:hypothetical protein K1719_018135 [Acacia pycnantha]|nr:hypothetical protein K1719_018135 [Acacia pycnantha]